MRYSFLSALALSFVASALGESISSPPAGASWPVNQNQQITWNTAGLTAPLNIHLVPAGAKDTTVIITEIALGVQNTGSFMWAPPATLTVENVEIIIVDAKNVLVISEVFIIVIIDTTTKKTTTTTPTKTSTKLSTVTQLVTVSTKATTQLITQTLVQTSSIKLSTTTVKSVVLATSTSKSVLLVTSTSKTTSFTLAAIQMPTSTFKLMTTSTTKPLTISTSSVKLGTAVTLATTSKPLNTTMLKSTATAAVSAAKVTFTGAASQVGFSNSYSVVSGGVVALLAMVFL